MANTPDQNIQHGVPIGDGIRDAETSGDGRVATGDRREEIHFERDEDGQLRAAHLKRPSEPLPPQMETTDGADGATNPAVEDVAVAPEGPSAWDARPINDGHDHPGKR